MQGGSFRNQFDAECEFVIIRSGLSFLCHGVCGRRIDYSILRSTKITIAERIKLMVRFAMPYIMRIRKGSFIAISTVQYLVAERDGMPVPKVIDFGVSKAIGNSLAESLAQTQDGQLIGTLEFMSPEQADTSNIDVDTRTDIYSLGVVLYVLVTGTAPFAVGTCDSFDLSSILKSIRDEEPTLPSQRLMAATDLNQLE